VASGRLGDMDSNDVAQWVAGYERAWRSPGTDALAGLFTTDAVYSQGPYEVPVVGLPAIGVMWERQRAGPDEDFAMTSDVVAVDGDTAVVRAEVHYGRPTKQEFRDLWVMRFATDGRCRAFEEWPFAPRPPAATDAT
jgi:ketosteroid isomerase-like protein